jgi:hypothetical protein
MSILLTKAQKVGGFDCPNGTLVIGLEKDVEALAAQGGGALPVDVGAVSGAGNSAWRPSTYFANMINGAGGDGTGVRNVTRHNFLQPFKAVRRATRFRLWFTTGLPAAAGGAFTLNGSTEIPTKNGAGTTFIPWRFGGKPTYDVPAGGGVLFPTDWMAYPIDAGDTGYIKGHCYAAGAAFDLPIFGSPQSTVSLSPAGTWESGTDAHATDASGVARGTAPWVASNYVAGIFRAVMIETDCAEDGRLATVDIWGDSIAAGGAMTARPSYLTQLMLASGRPYANYAISGSNQSQIPSLAYNRMGVARGDIAIMQHGRNAGSDTASYLACLKLFRGLGYRKIIACTPTDQTNAGNTAITSSSATVRAYIQTLLQAGEIDAVWDAKEILQPAAGGGLWAQPGWYDGSGLHPTDPANDAVYAAGIAAGWLDALT